MNPLLTAAKFCSKESLEKLTKFHRQLIAWVAWVDGMRSDGEDFYLDHDTEAMYDEGVDYLTFLKDLGVLEQIQPEPPT